MGSALKRLKRRKRALNDLDNLLDHPENVYAIHYSCEGFFDIKDGRSPRITSIAVANLHTKQTTSFSIHKMAELESYNIAAIDEHYDELEKKMLDEFYEFARGHSNVKWLHWNMRDINYGFPAIAHRYKVLKGAPVQIQDSRRFDLARMLQAIYGPSYIGHPRLKSLVDRNKVTDRSFLSGQQEADAFTKGDYIALHQSTLRKVGIIATIAEMAWNDTLQTNATWKDKYGANFVGLTERISNHVLFKWAGFIAIVITIVRVLIDVLS